MKISIFGLGYVGAVSAACFAKLGHEVIGADINPHKVEMLNKGEVPIKEPQLDNLIKEAVKNNKFKAVQDDDYTIENSDISFICVKTPSDEEGEMDISALIDVSNRIATALQSKKAKKHIIVIRSTIPPGTIDKLEKILESRDLKKGIDFIFASNPEFLREGTAIKDFFEPPYIVIGSEDKDTQEIIKRLYPGINTRFYLVSTKTAESIKFVNNSWHALEISFVNEISSICKQLNMNSKELIDLFASDTKLNLSDYYLKPNMGYGGSCLPKDLASLNKLGQNLKVDCPVLKSIAPSNLNQIKRAYNFIKKKAEESKVKEVGVLGVSFKPGTDDIRGSPIIYIIEKLKSDGFKVKVYDPIVRLEEIENIRNSYRDTIYDPLLSELMGVKNFKDLLDDIEKMISPLEETLKCKIIVLSAKMSEENLASLKSDQTLINTRAIISLPKDKIKAKCLEVW